MPKKEHLIRAEMSFLTKRPRQTSAGGVLAYQETCAKVQTSQAIRIPRKAPLMTSTGRWPSFSGRLSLSSSPSCFLISLISLACSPAACRTPIASYITTVARTTDKAKVEELTPSRIAAAAAIAQTVAEWELGMPPVSQKRFRQSSPARMESRIVLKNCAKNHERIAEESRRLMLNN